MEIFFFFSRMSTAGSSGLTVIKDTRQFGDKMYRERMIRQLVEVKQQFLSCLRY